MIVKTVKVAPHVAALEKVLAALDAAPHGPHEPILKNVADKEHYETRLTFVLRRRAAARYHHAQVERLLEKIGKDAEKKLSAAADKIGAGAGSGSQTTGPGATQTVSRISCSEDFVHELSAFLAAVRSGLDFLAMVAAKSLPGVSAHSVNTLIGLAKKSSAHPILAVVKKHEAWLTSLKDYRDEVIHRVVVQAPAVGWVLSHKGKSSKAVLPIVVPKRTPKYASDTRMSRMINEDPPIGLSRQEIHGQVTMPDGTQTVLSHSVKYEPTEGYIPIETFMLNHLASYDEFTKDVFQALAELHFKQVKVAS